MDFAFSYNQKLQVLEYLADPENWKFRDELDWLASGVRRWGTHSLNDNKIHYGHNSSRLSTWISGPANAQIWIRQRGGRTFISDEWRTRATLSPAGIVDLKGACHPGNADDIRRAGQNKQFTAGLDWTKAIVTFDENGRKYVFFEPASVFLVFDKPGKNEEWDLHSTRFLNAIPLTLPGFEGAGYWQHINAAKLVVAEDFSIEPGIIAKGGLRQFETFDDLTAERDKEEKTLSEPWNGTTGFTGFDVAVPKQFAIEYRKETGHSLLASSDTKRQIVNHGRIFQQAVGLCHAAHGGNAESRIHKLPALLARGFAIAGADGAEWRCAVARSSSGPGYAIDIRDALVNKFRLNASEFMVFNHTRQDTFVAVNMAAYERGKNREKTVETASMAAIEAEIASFECQFRNE